jgi:hypothetical protein
MGDLMKREGSDRLGPKKRRTDLSLTALSPPRIVTAVAVAVTKQCAPAPPPADNGNAAGILDRGLRGE